MRFQKHIIKLFFLSFFFLLLILSGTSCDIFFRKELRQDQELAYYRHRMLVVSDSIKDTKGRIKAYDEFLEKIKVDKYLITPRKRNILLSEVYTTLGVEYFDSDSIEKAIESNNTAIALNEANHHAYYNRAYLYHHLGSDSLAIADYSKALDYNEGYVDAYYNRGILYESRTDYQLAVEDYSRAIKLKPAYIADVYNNRGNVYQIMNFLDKAVADYDEALKVDSAMAVVYCNRGDVYLKLGEVDRAVNDYNKAVQIDSLDLQIAEKMKLLKSEFLK